MYSEGDRCFSANAMARPESRACARSGKAMCVYFKTYLGEG